MTGYAESSPPMPLSRLTIAAMEDLGYAVNFAAADNYTLMLASLMGVASSDIQFASGDVQSGYLMLV
jgi:hypothetical protein